MVEYQCLMMEESKVEMRCKILEVLRREVF